MIVLVALALWLALPVPATPGDDPPHVTRAVDEWVQAQRAAGRVLEPLGTRTVGERAWATFVDRTGGCVRGWARMRMTFAADSLFGGYEIDEIAGAPCDQPAQPLNHLLHLATAIARKDWVGVGEHLPPGGLFPIAREEPGKPMRRKTHDRDQVLAGKVDLPACDVFEDTPTCDEPGPSGRVTCRCAHPLHALEVDFMMPREGAPEPAELVSIRHRQAVTGLNRKTPPGRSPGH